MRRRGDSYVNATQILKVAGVDKGRRTKILEKEILPGKHEIVQGGYGKYQGTWSVSNCPNDVTALSCLFWITGYHLNEVVILHCSMAWHPYYHLCLILLPVPTLSELFLSELLLALHHPVPCLRLHHTRALGPLEITCLRCLPLLRHPQSCPALPFVF
jgi:hypothetical protein